MKSLASIDAVLADFKAQSDWLLTLITDPAGERYFLDKSTDQRLLEYEEQLARMAAFLNFIDNPQARFKSIHVAGTSGKGSVTAMIAAILKACGRRTGHHVSPYLQICNEKLVVDGQLIRPSSFSELVRRFRTCYMLWKAQGGTLRYGEAWVALTFLWFAAQQLDWGVIETGMGGRYDPTNLLPSKLAVITNVDYDHVKALGPDLVDIAHHKAGIIKAGGRVVTAATEPNVLAVIESEAKRKGAQLYRLGDAFDYEIHQMDINGTTLSVRTPWQNFERIQVNLPGLFQARNAATAVAAVALLAQEYEIPLNETTISAGLSHLTLTGRLERVQDRPLTILDGAHNPAKMSALAGSLAALFPRRGVTAVIGTIVSKEAHALIEALAPLVDHFILTRPQVFAKPALQTETLAEMVAELAPEARVTQVASVPDAVATGLAESDPDSLLLITGSLYLVGQARERWFPSQQQLIALEQGAGL